MLDNVSAYAVDWWYELNALKSAVLVIGESKNSRVLLCQSQRWYVSGETIPEKDTQHHLGILRSVFSSTLLRTSECCYPAVQAGAHFLPFTNWVGPFYPEYSGPPWIPLYQRHPCWPVEWKRTVKRFLLASQYADFLTECDPLSQCTEVKLGRTIPHLFVSRSFPRVTKRNITRIRLLVNCHGLESDTCRFRHSVSDPTCRLCHSGPEDIEHFISHYPALSSARILLPLLAASEIASSLESDPTSFAEYILGIRWINDPPLQREIKFIHNLHAEHLRSQLAITQSPTP